MNDRQLKQTDFQVNPSANISAVQTLDSFDIFNLEAIISSLWPASGLRQYLTDVK